MLAPEEIAQRRVIERIVLEKDRGELWLNGTIQRLRFDDIVDLVQAVEMIDLKFTGKLLNRKFRSRVVNRAACQADVLIAGDADLYDGSQGPSPEPGAWYMLVEIAGARWDNWFRRTDELIKLLHIIIKEAQGDPYVPAPSILMPGVAHA